MDCLHSRHSKRLTNVFFIAAFHFEVALAIVCCFTVIVTVTLMELSRGIISSTFVFLAETS